MARKSKTSEAFSEYESTRITKTNKSKTSETFSKYEDIRITRTNSNKTLYKYEHTTKWPVRVKQVKLYLK